MLDAMTLFERAGADAARGCQVIDAAVLAGGHYPPVNVGWPLAVMGLRDRAIVAGVQAVLLAAYPANHVVQIAVATVGAEPVGDESELAAVALADLAALGGLDAGANLYVPPLPAGRDFTDLQETVAHLRSPGGCPWDREQTLHSLRHGLLSECVEVMEAIDLDAGQRDNGAHIAEELGDVLLLVTMMVQIAVEAGRFHMADVVDHIVRKLVRRHPHVFGDVDVAGSGEVTANWEDIKAQERAEKGVTVESPLDGVPAYLPALEKARELQSKASKAGLLDRSALAESMPGLADLLGPKPDETGVGELLWTLTALAREHGVVAENALRQYAVAYRQAAEDELASGQSSEARGRVSSCKS